VTGDDGDVAEVEHLPESQRFEISVDGRRVGMLDYDVREGAFVALHTEIDPAYGGRGLGGVLVEQVLDHVRTTGLRLVPACPFVADYVDKNSRYSDLLATGRVGPAPPGAGAS